MNILTFDIEEWYIEQQFGGARKAKYALFDRYLDMILELLEKTGTKATFFCLGGIARDFPYVIEKIASQGHEIGCHSDRHLWLTKMTPEELKADTQNALEALEKVSGQKIVSYRAPAFSIGENNKWAFDVLAECGIKNDASVFPATRDFGGFPSFGESKPTKIETANGIITEFPINLASIGGKSVAFSGGGYFRLFPYWYVVNQLKHSDYFMGYFHIGDLIHNTSRMMTRKEYEEYFKEKGPYHRRLARYFKSHIGTSHAFPKMARLVENNDFVNISQATEQWSR